MRRVLANRFISLLCPRASFASAAAKNPTFMAISQSKLRFPASKSISMIALTPEHLEAVRASEGQYAEFCRNILRPGQEERLFTDSPQAALEAITALGASIYRKNHLRLCHLAVRKLLPHVQKKSLQSSEHSRTADLLSFHFLPQLIISLSNCNFYDELLFKEFGQLVRNEKYLDSPYFARVKAHRLIALFWALKRIRFEDEEVYRLLRKRIYSLREQLNEKSSLQLLWIESQERFSNPSLAHENLIQNMIETFLQEKAKRQEYVYNPKNSFQIGQIFVNLYPEVAKLILHNEVLQLEEARQHARVLEAKKHPFASNYVAFLEILQYSYEVLRLKQGRDLREYAIIVEQQQKGSENKVERIKKSKISFDNKFEGNIQRNLAQIEGLQYITNQLVGIYEVDAIVWQQREGTEAGPKKVLEINGYNHFVVTSDKQPQERQFTAPYEMKLRHLRQLGFDEIALLNHFEFERFDSDDVKRTAYIKSLLRV